MKKNRDIEGLKLGIKAMEISSENAKLATLNFLYDKYILQPIRDKKRKDGGR